MLLPQPPEQQPEQQRQQRELQQQLETAGFIALGAAALLAKEIAGAIANSNPLVDQSPSTCVAVAMWNPVTDTVSFDFVRGGRAVYHCSAMEWAAYRSSPSKGAFFNEFFADR